MILVTGATGNVGSALLDALAGRTDVRAFVRSPDAARRLATRGFDPFVGSFEDRDALERAAAGASRLFLLSPPGAADMVDTQTALVNVARAAGVQHIVKLSSIGADEATGARIIDAHRRVERQIEASGLAWTHLRPNWFMQNELAQAESVRDNGAFHAPDVTRVSMVDARDVAAVAARVLTEAGHDRRAYVLTGPEALDYAGVAATYAKTLDRNVRWHEVSLEEARHSMLAGGLPETLATGFTEILARYRKGGVTASVSPDAARLLGRPPRSFGDFVSDHRRVFDAASLAA